MTKFFWVKFKFIFETTSYRCNNVFSGSEASKTSNLLSVQEVMITGKLLSLVWRSRCVKQNIKLSSPPGHRLRLRNLPSAGSFPGKGMIIRGALSIANIYPLNPPYSSSASHVQSLSMQSFCLQGQLTLLPFLLRLPLPWYDRCRLYIAGMKGLHHNNHAEC